ncbi:hypothetical protein [Azohydromonas aeria]|uniref:hypothetical protein n=1 Tax=Azohydromonas aeria TaxID=2590212 RepID=UPI0012F80FD3|nr:hypothetical protein [Azohydromonas aeria]
MATRQKVAEVLIGLGRAASFLVLVFYPGLLIAGVMSLGAGYGGLVQCYRSVFGAFICTGLIYPVLYFAGYWASKALMARQRYVEAVVSVWGIFLVFMTLLFASEVGDSLLRNLLRG